MRRPSLRTISAVTVVAGLCVTSFLSGQEKVIVKEKVVVPATRTHFRAKQIIGANVSIEDNTEIGIVDDIVLDDYGNVDYLLVINSDGKLVTIPWDAAQFNPEKRVAYVPITPERFRTVPSYTVKEYPLFSAPTYRSEVYKYYGLTPAQERRMIRRTPVVVP